MEETRIVARASTITLDGALARVFPLFGPIKEKVWAEGWNPVILVGDPGRVEEHMVFRTQSGHSEDAGQATWIVSKYDPEISLIEYTVFTQERIWWICIECRAREADESTDAFIKYTYLGLNEQASRYNDEALERMFRHDLKDWEMAINHYLRTGTQLRHDRSEPHG